jgi:C1A family cysteine protease
MFQVLPDFFSYRDGVYSGGDTCVPGSSSINHGLLVIGFGTDSFGIDYWLVQNSWGKNWG